MTKIMIGENKYSARTGTMRWLRRKEFWTLQQIGSFYGLSRERIRQILGNDGHKTIALRTKRKHSIIRSAISKTNAELSNELNVSTNYISKVRGKTRHAIEPTGQSALGRVGEERFKYVAQLHGYSVKLMPFRHPFDAVINGKINCDVKTTLKPIKGKTINPLWNFHIGKPKKWEDVDIFALLILPLDLWFFIPADNLRDINRGSLVRFVYPHTGRGRTSFQKYAERWDIIDRLA